MRFGKAIKGRIDQELSKLSKLVDDNKDKITKQLEQINKLILELSAKLNEITGQASIFLQISMNYRNKTSEATRKYISASVYFLLKYG